LAGRTRDPNPQIADLKKFDLDGLRRCWQSLFRKKFPAHLPRHLIVAILAYQLQAQASGDLGDEYRRYLDAVGRTAAKTPKSPVAKFSNEKQQFKAGTVFVREHAGVQHRVLATPQGLQWRERHYPSLSAVAKAITGTNWNGRRFFGLPKGRD
jgi:hypothetical protein